MCYTRLRTRSTFRTESESESGLSTVEIVFKSESGDTINGNKNTLHFKKAINCHGMFSMQFYDMARPETDDILRPNAR